MSEFAFPGDPLEIKASEYSTPAELVGAIQEKISQLYVDWVWVNFSASRQKVTPNTADHVCKGLMMAHELSLDQIKADGGDPRTPSFGLASCGEVSLVTPDQAWDRLDRQTDTVVCRCLGELESDRGSDTCTLCGKLFKSQREVAGLADEKPDGQAENAISRVG